jgi:muramidase (phage lysozyme)
LFGLNFNVVGIGFPRFHFSALGLGVAASVLLPQASAYAESVPSSLMEPLRISSPLLMPLVASRSVGMSGSDRPQSQLATLKGGEGPSSADRFFPFALTPERRALLNTIRYAEGTWARGEDVGYRIMFGGGLMPDLTRHPDRVVSTGRYASAAAGAYQFMPFTWAMASRSLQLQGFGPEVQDQAALFLIQRRGALHLADQGMFTPHLAAKLAPEWASFPTLAGHSYYGQPVKRYAALKAFYEANLQQLRALAAPPTTVAQEPSCEPEDSLRCRLERLESIGPRGAAQKL